MPQKPLAYMLISLLALLSLTMLPGCQQKKDPNTIKVGIIDGPETTLWEMAQKNAKDRYGLNIKLIKFSDYTMPNEALENGDIDANAFQHQPFLDAQINDRHYNIMAVANTFIFPMAMYSHKITKLTQLQQGDQIAIPNDPSNEARALLLLQAGGLIQLRKGANTHATTTDISDNPKQLRISELDAAQLPRVLPDVTAAVITDDYAQPAGLLPKNALLVEDKDSPYMNIIAIRPKDKTSPNIKHLVASFQTDAIKEKAEALSHGSAIAGW
jgi:D-methionine transport system substrate-binding protein